MSESVVKRVVEVMFIYQVYIRTCMEVEMNVYMT